MMGTDDLAALDACFRRLDEMIVQAAWKDSAPARRIIGVIRAEIKDALASGGSANVLPEVRRLYRSMFPPHGGLSEFYIWDDDMAVRRRKNAAYEDVKRQIAAILG